MSYVLISFKLGLITKGLTGINVIIILLPETCVLFVTFVTFIFRFDALLKNVLKLAYIRLSIPSFCMQPTIISFSSLPMSNTHEHDVYKCTCAPMLAFNFLKHMEDKVSCLIILLCTIFEVYMIVPSSLKYFSNFVRLITSTEYAFHSAQYKFL